MPPPRLIELLCKGTPKRSKIRTHIALHSVSEFKKEDNELTVTISLFIYQNIDMEEREWNY